MLFGVLIVLFVIVCILLCLVVLIQSDKGGGLSGALGGGLSGANALLGTQDTANILTRATTILAVTYMVLCILISLFVAGNAGRASTGKSLMKERAEKYESPAAVLQGGGLPLDEDAAAAEGAAAGEGSGALPLGAPVESAEEAAPAGEPAPSGTAEAP